MVLKRKSLKNPASEWIPEIPNKKKKSHPDQAAYKKAVVDLICLNGLPFSIVEGDGFKKFVNTIAPHLEVQSRRTVVRDLEAAVSELKPKIKVSVGCSVHNNSYASILKIYLS